MRRGILLLLACTCALAVVMTSEALTVRAVGPPSPGALVGLFSIRPGSCSSLPTTAPTGSYFFMEPAAGIGFVGNNSSPCSAQQGDYTPLEPGSEGGLVTGRYQLDPVPTFDSAGNSLAARIIKPVSFFNSAFGLATTCADQQQAPTTDGNCPATPNAQFPDYPVPSLSFQPCAPGATAPSASAFCLSGDLRALGATWNNIAPNCAASAGVGCYDQGAAGDSGGKVTCDTGATGCTFKGTFDPASGDYTLAWKAPIHGGAFNGFIGNWVITGTFTPATPGSSSGSAHVAAAAPPGGGADPVLHGVLGIAAGQCGSGTPTGSWFQMTKGGAISNFSSSCSGGNYSLIAPGAAGGIRLDGFQPNPTPTFDGNGSSLARDIIQAVPWFGRAFSLATNPQDVQNAPGGPAKFPAPHASFTGSTLTVDLSSLNATWNGTPNGTCSSGQAGNNGCYLQGAPAVTGTYNQATHRWAVTWTSTIHGGAFNGATGTWHLEGTFTGTVAPQVVTEGYST